MSTPLVLAGGAGFGLWQLQCVCVGGGGEIFSIEEKDKNVLLTTPHVSPAACTGSLYDNFNTD